MDYWPNGTYATNDVWWSMTHEDRQVVLDAISALGIEPVDVLNIDFGDDSATVTLFHVTEEAGRAHLEGHCEGEPAWRTGSSGQGCTCGREVGDSHPVCVRVETVKYPA